jgi:predicted GH43/DUF377 family glycosyl hydrolase
MAFSDMFGDDPRENQTRWRRDPGNPIISTVDEWSGEFVAPSSLLETDSGLTLFVEGGVSERENIGAYTCPAPCDPDAAWVADAGNPILTPATSGFDRGSVFDPAVVDFAGRRRLYYSATSGGAHEFAELAADAPEVPAEPECIGVAEQRDGSFTRRSRPVLVGRCPAVIAWRETLYLFFVRVLAGGYRIHLATSQDGLEFVEPDRSPVLDVGAAGEWDSYTVTTPQVFFDGDHFTMLYAGDRRRIDDPTGIGVAVSEDLVRWRKHPGNPVLSTGDPGQFDSVSVANAVPLRCAGGWQILYAGSDRSVADGLHSQIGRAWLTI